MNSWDQDAYIIKVQPATNRFLAKLAKKGIYYGYDTWNILFTKGEKSVEISYHSLYRYSGISRIVKFNDNNPIAEIHEVTDDMYYDNYLMPVIELLLK